MSEYITPYIKLPYEPIRTDHPEYEDLDELTRFQEIDATVCAESPTRASIDISDPGTGKTRTARLISERLKAQTVLIIAPPNTRKGWLKEFPHIKDITRAKAHNKVALDNGEPGAYFVTRNFFGLSGTETKDSNGNVTRERLWWWKNTHADLVIFDESHAINRKDGTVFKSVIQLPHTGHFHAMSATPYGNKFPGIYGVARWLWRQYIDPAQRRWETHWCTTKPNYHAKTFDGSPAMEAVGERFPGRFVSSLPCVVYRKAKLVPVKQYNVRVDLSPEQRRIWDSLSETAIAELDGEYLVANIPIVQRIRLRQACLATPTLEEEGTVTYSEDAESIKLDALKELILPRHQNEAILCFTTSAKFAEIAAKRIPGAIAWTGSLSKTKREALLEDFSEGVIFAQWQAISEGADGLQKYCSTEVIFDFMPGQPMLSEQGAGRLNRTGQVAEHISRYVLIANDTDDDEYFEKTIDSIRAKAVSLSIDND